MDKTSCVILILCGLLVFSTTLVSADTNQSINVRWSEEYDYGIGAMERIGDNLIFINVSGNYGRFHILDSTTGEELQNETIEYSTRNYESDIHDSMVEDGKAYFTYMCEIDVRYVFMSVSDKEGDDIHTNVSDGNPEDITTSVITENKTYYGTEEGEIWNASHSLDDFEKIEDVVNESIKSMTVNYPYMYLASNEYVVNYNITNNSVEWQQSMINNVSWHNGLQYYDGILYAVNETGVLYAIDTDNGDIEWKYDGGVEEEAMVLVDDGIIFLGCGDGSITGLDIESGEVEFIYKEKHETRITSIVADDGYVWSGDVEGIIIQVDTISPLRRMTDMILGIIKFALPIAIILGIIIGFMKMALNVRIR